MNCPKCSVDLGDISGVIALVSTRPFKACACCHLYAGLDSEGNYLLKKYDGPELFCAYCRDQQMLTSRPPRQREFRFRASYQ